MLKSLNRKGPYNTKSVNFLYLLQFSIRHVRFYTQTMLFCNIFFGLQPIFKDFFLCRASQTLVYDENTV